MSVDEAPPPGGIGVVVFCMRETHISATVFVGSLSALPVRSA